VPPEPFWLILALAAGLGLGLLAARIRQRTRDSRQASVAGSGEVPASSGAAVRAAPARPAPITGEQAASDEDLTELVQLGEAIGLGVVRLDADLVVRQANQIAHGLLGKRLGSLLGQSAIEAFADHRVEEVLRSALELGAASGELTLRGSAQPTLLLRARRAHSGGSWLVLEDVSELRRLQRIRAEFIDNLSHELRTPLTSVRLLTETLAADLEGVDVPPRIRQGVQMIDVESGHLVQMVNELLDLAKIEQGSAVMSAEEVDIAAVARASRDRLRLFAERQGVRLELDLAPDLPRVRGDEERLGQLLINLLHNAVKFSPPDSAVTVRGKPAGDEVIISVEDHGVGIPRADLERIFERFYKVDKARVRGQGGTGLGLSIARHIAEGHGGRIWVESQEGVGSTFSVAIPTSAAA
jgi:two-component system phosphate regulon sensor histidine kinase PhoR